MNKNEKLRALLASSSAPTRRSKFGNVKTTLMGLKFDSQREAKCWPGLVLREKAGEIRNLTRQKPYELTVNRQRICVYYSDFEWDEPLEFTEGTRHVVADAKGFRTREYAIKKALMKALFQIDILEL